MKKAGTVMLSAVCAVLLVAATFQVRLIPTGDGEKTLIFSVPFGDRPGGSTFSDLREQLFPLYGTEDVQTEAALSQWQGEPAAVYDIPSYDFEYLGQSIHGDNYLSCKVTTLRSVVLEGEEEKEIPDTRRDSVYIACDPADEGRAAILWDTLKEEYSDSEAYFNGTVLK